MNARRFAGIALLLFLTWCAGAAVPAGAAGGCGKLTPRHLAFEHQGGTRTGKLTWRAQAGKPRLRLAYRVIRDGEVVGQTRRHAMRMPVVPGRRYVLQVRLVRGDVPLRTCTARLVARVSFRPPGAVGPLAMSDVGNTTATLTWKTARPGDAPVAGYRVFRDGKTYRQVPGTTITVPLATSRDYRFAVAAADTRGTLGPRTKAVSLRTGFSAPGAVSDFVVGAVGDTSAHLEWSAAPRGDAPVAGYRVTRDGKTWRQVPGTSVDVPLASKRDYAFTVAAVDTRGTPGPAAGPVRVSTGHSPPGAPRGLAAADVTDTSATLTWGAAQASSGRIVGYRLYRDGTLVGQFSGTSAPLSNLPSATDLRFTVTAVDSFGYLGPATPPLTVRTGDPDPTRGSAHAFLLATTGESFRDLQAHYRQVGTVYPTYFECRSDSTIAGADDPLVSRWASLRRIAVLPRFDCQRPAVLHDILTSPVRSAALIAELAGLASRHGYGGINLDFEAGLATDRDALSVFVARLASALHAQGDRLAVDVSPKSAPTTTGRSGFYDYEAIGAVADTVVVMDWGLHWTTSVPGPLSDLAWATNIADYVAAQPHRDRFVLGMPLYGIDWAAGGGKDHPGVPLQHDDLMALAGRVGATPGLDPVSQEKHFGYVDGAGVSHDVWFTDGETTAVRLAMARDRGLGVAFWRLGREDQGLWDQPLLAVSP